MKFACQKKSRINSFDLYFEILKLKLKNFELFKNLPISFKETIISDIVKVSSNIKIFFKIPILLNFSFFKTLTNDN